MKIKKLGLFILIIGIVAGMVVLFTDFYKIHPIQIENNGIDRIDIFLDFQSIALLVGNDAYITKDKGIDAVVKYLNGITVWSKKYSEDDLPGNIPSGRIIFYNNKDEELRSIYFYGDIISTDLGFYKIDTFSTYQEINKLCEKYGE